MDYYAKIQETIDYIEDNLKDNIDINSLTKISCFSLTHLYRIFQAIVGDSIKSYIQKRRLSDAAVDVITSDKRLIDIAFEYRYNSQEVFTRAFLRAFNITPGKLRRRKVKIELYPRVNVEYNTRPEFERLFYSKPRIVIDKEFKVVGIKDIVKPGSPEIKNLWLELNKMQSQLNNLVNPNYAIGICEYIPDITDNSDFSYLASFEVNEFGTIPKGMIHKTIPNSKYIVFTHKGTLLGLKETFNNIYGIWLPFFKYQLRELETLEVYNKESEYDFDLDIYIPIV